MLQPDLGSLPGIHMPKAQPLALIVDADKRARRICRTILEDLGCAIDETDSGVAAISSARSRTPSVILLGQQLRDVSGWEVGQWLQTMPSLLETPVVVLGAAPDADPHSIKMPFVTYLRAPLSAKSLRQSLRSALKK